MATESEVLLALNEALQDYETEVIKATARVTEIRVITGDRDGARSEIQKILDKNRTLKNIPQCMTLMKS